MNILFSFIIGVGLCSMSAHASDDRPVLMVGLGDSLTSATLANTTAIEAHGQKKPIWEALTVFQDVLGGVGANRETYSWSTGKEIQSHYSLLNDWMDKNEPGVSLVPLNFSIPGAQANKLTDQVHRVLEVMHTGGYRYLKYVTISIGGNDICTSKDSDTPTEAEDFKKQVKEAFSALAEVNQSEPVAVFFASIPNVARLGRDDIQDTKSIGNLSCREIRKRVHNSCKNLINFDGEEGYEASRKKVEEQNDLIRSLTLEAAQEHPNLVTHFSNSFFEQDITPDMISYDCFHPNRYAQEVMATKSFKTEWFDKSLWLKNHSD